MIELYMYFGMGFLIAALGGLAVVPLVHGRAVRLTTRRLGSAIPLSMAEIQADRDLLRAEFALSTRRLEAELDKLKVRSANERAELGRKSNAVNRLTVELTALRDQLGSLEETLAERSDVSESEHSAPDDNSDQTETPSTRTETALLANSQSDEVASLRMEVKALREWLALAGAEIRAGKAQHMELESANEKLMEERHKFENFHRRVAELVQQLLRQGVKDIMVNARVQDLEGRLAKQSQLLSQRESELVRLQGELSVACKAEADLHGAIIEVDSRANIAATEERKLQASLDRANGERMRLAYELAAIKRKLKLTDLADPSCTASEVEMPRAAAPEAEMPRGTEILLADLEVAKPAA